jgi:Mn2+/Fe2+ NRAMP family transporter
MRAHYPRWLLLTVVTLLLVANIINIGADLGAMGEALSLVCGGPQKLYVVLFAVGCAYVEVFSRYDRYEAILKWSTLVLFFYVATVFYVHVPWRDVLKSTVVPSMSVNRDFIIAVVAVLGTTISPYLIFWQSSQEVEDERVCPDSKPLNVAPEQAPREIKRIRIDTYVGMAFSNIVGFFIIVTTAATLNAHGITDIHTAAEAAAALRPIAGDFAFAAFALGIIGTGLLAVPVLAGSAAYAVGEALDWPTGLARLPMDAKAFYGTIVVATLIGIGFNFVDIDPMKALFWTAVINGIIAVPLMIVMMLMAVQPRVRGNFVVPRGLQMMGWLSTICMAVTVVAMFVTL